MDDNLKLEIQTICIVHIIAIIMAIVFLMFFYIKANKDSALKAFLIMQLSMIGWMIFKIFKTVSPDVHIRWLFIAAYLSCTCIVEIAFLEFGYAYNNNRSLSVKARLLLYILPFLQIGVIWTNPLHHLFYARYDFWGDAFGPLFYLHTLIEYVYIGIGFSYCYRTFKDRLKSKVKWYVYLISLAIIGPLVMNLLYITKVIHRFVYGLGITVIFDITPIVFTWSLMVFVFATSTSDFIRLSPILKHEIVHKMDTAVAVVHKNHKVLYENDKMLSVFSDMSFALNDLLSDVTLNQARQRIQWGHHYFSIHLRKVRDVMDFQYVLTLKDITSYKHAEEAIEMKQDEVNEANLQLKKNIELLKEASKIGARNFVARELHDIIGHSLVVTIKLLEVAKLYYHKDSSMSWKAVEDAADSLKLGIVNMQAVENQDKLGLYTGEDLNKELLKMINKIKATSMDVKLYFKGVYFAIDEALYTTIVKVSRELITNSLKHSYCKDIFISVHVKKEALSMMFMDNGVGSDQIVLGNGLNGIQDRVHALQGHIEFASSSGEGFMTKINIHHSSL